MEMIIVPGIGYIDRAVDGSVESDGLLNYVEPILKLKVVNRNGKIIEEISELNVGEEGWLEEILKQITQNHPQTIIK